MRGIFQFRKKPGAKLQKLTVFDQKGPVTINSLGKDREFNPFSYSNTWEYQENEGSPRLKIAPRMDHVDLLIKLAQALPEPFGLLYILAVPRRENQVAGRYQSPLLTGNQLAEFLKEFRNALEQDGRHHVWIASFDENWQPIGRIIYDNHNIIYAYGPLEEFEQVLRLKKFTQSEKVAIPYPHSHHYHSEFDDEVDRIVKAFDWKRTELLDVDE